VTGCCEHAGSIKCGECGRKPLLCGKLPETKKERKYVEGHWDFTISGIAHWYSVGLRAG
jgi:hypothetical protein